jgi:hypothetical protein
MTTVHDNSAASVVPRFARAGSFPGGPGALDFAQPDLLCTGCRLPTAGDDAWHPRHLVSVLVAASDDTLTTQELLASLFQLVVAGASSRTSRSPPASRLRRGRK